MKILRRAVSLFSALLLLTAVCTSLSSCMGDGRVTVRYLNFKPEIAEKYKALAAEYEKQTGVRVIVDTAANNAYEQTLAAKMATAEAPTLFQINGPKGYAAWKDYCADLSETELYRHLSDKSLAVTGADGGVYGIPYVVEGYGILYNSAITDAYFSLSDRKTSFSSMQEINSLEKLTALVEDMTRRKGELGIEGVFAVTSLKNGEDWRWQTHLANLPISYEFAERGIDLSGDGTGSITFSHADGFKRIFDLYINHSTVDRRLLGTKTVSDSMAEFALGKCAMVQNGNWAWSQIADIKGNTVSADKIKYLPIYIGAEGEEAQGLCIGTENFYAINKTATEEEQRAAADFIYWLYSSEFGKRYITEELGFIPPFDTFSAEEIPSDPLAREVLRYMQDEDLNSVPWNFTVFPSQKFKEELGASLLRYAQGSKDWSAVVKDAVAAWQQESES